MTNLEQSVEQFKKVMEKQLARVERMKADTEATDFTKKEKVIIGICGGDGIGPVITHEAERVLRFLLKEEV